MNEGNQEVLTHIEQAFPHCMAIPHHRTGFCLHRQTKLCQMGITAPKTEMLYGVHKAAWPSHSPTTQTVGHVDLLVQVSAI